MLIYPAIDLMGGQAVRLHKGVAASREVVGDPLELAERFKAAPLLHIVDLDGAFAGAPQQTELIGKLAGAHPIQAGGGIRSGDDVTRLFDLGCRRVVLGTAAVKDPALVEQVVGRWGPDRLVAALDVKDGQVALAGWTEVAPLSPERAAAQLAQLGIRWFLCTATHRDGTLEGPDLSTLRRIQAVSPELQVIASGGIGNLDDLRLCKDLAAVVVGKALYAGRFSLAEALAC